MLSKNFTTFQLKLRFFDLEANIKSDSGNFISLFTQMYRRFQVDTQLPPAQTSAEFILLTKPDNQWGKPVIILDGEVLPLCDQRLLEGYAYESILSAIVTRVRSHLLIHAGVVSRDGQGVILVADARHGKTTLVLELIRRGFQFLSDEMAALGRADRLAEPISQGVRLRPGSLERSGWMASAGASGRHDERLLIDIEDLQTGCLGAP